METISKTIKKLIQVEPYYGLFACGINKEFSTEIDTLAVSIDGLSYKLEINKEFWDSLSEDQRLGVIKHEMLHIIFYHLTMYDDFEDIMTNNGSLLNIAQDMEVNSYIDKSLLPGNPYIPEHFNFLPRQGTKYYFEELKKKLNNNNQNSGGSGSGNGNQQDNGDLNNGELVDSHDNWKNANLSDEMKKLIRDQIDFQIKEVAKAMKSRGTIPSEIEEILGKLATLKPPSYNWKMLLRRALGTTYDVIQKRTRRKESLRFEGAYGLKRKKKVSLLVGIDTSGSISTKDLKDFFNEIYHIYKAGADITIVEFDTTIHDVYQYQGKTPNYVHGRGGTDFTECVEYYNKHTSDYYSLFILTDGYAPVKDLKFKKPAWWVLTANHSEQTYPGRTIIIKD